MLKTIVGVPGNIEVPSIQKPPVGTLPEYKTFYLECSGLPGAVFQFSGPTVQWSPPTDVMIQKIFFMAEMDKAGVRTRLDGQLSLTAAATNILNPSQPAGLQFPAPAGASYVYTLYRWPFQAQVLNKDLENCEAYIPKVTNSLPTNYQIRMDVNSPGGIAFAGTESVFWFIVICYKEIN